MKRVQLLFSIILLLLPAPGRSALAEGIKKEKKISGRFEVQTGDVLSIENRYGLVHINTWDKNEITVEVTITASAPKEERAAELLDKISVSQKSKENGHRITYKTVLANAFTNGKDESYSISYTVNMPKKIQLEVTNKFGDVYLDDFQGKLSMVVDYGALTCNKLTGADKQIEVKFGSAKISRIEIGSIKMSYSKLSIDKATDIILQNSFGKSEIDYVDRIVLEQKYGDVSIGTVYDMSGSVSFADIDVDKLETKADMDLKYCGRADFKNISHFAELIHAKAKFSNIILGLATDNSFNIDITIAYGEIKGELKNKTQYPIEYNSPSKPGHSSTHNFRGRTGKGDGHLIIESEYGNVVFN